MGKIIELDLLKKNLRKIKNKCKKIVLCHGCFDLMHPGHIKHFQEAKKMGDILIVTVTPDKFVDKGPGRPVFNQGLRADSIAALECVDYVAINKWPTAEELLRFLKPDIYVKGQEFEKLEDKTGKIQKEYDIAKETGIEVRFTHEIVFSSTKLLNQSDVINNFLNIYSKQTKDFLRNFSSKYAFSTISEKLNSLRKLKVLIVGEGIIDEYNYCASMGKAAKANLVVNKHLSREVFAGGAFAIANHVAGLCDNVQLVTLLGKNDPNEGFVSGNLKSNIISKFFHRDDGPTIVKKRYIDQSLNQKLFEVNYLNEGYIDADCEAKVITYLKSEIPKYDLLLVSDFGHGFITNEMIRIIEKLPKKIAVNTQTNAVNTGYNMITKYHNPNYVCLDETEARWATQERFTDIEEVVKKLSNILDTDYFITTLGKKGSIGINRNNEINRTPIFSSKVVDTVGAGDAFFAFTAPCFAQGMPLELVSFIGNAVGALAVQIVCNKKSIEKHELLEFIQTILK